MKALHDEFDKCWKPDTSSDSDGDIPSGSMDGFLYEHRNDVFMALRDYVKKWTARAEIAATIKTARDSLDATLKTFERKPE